MFIFKSLIKMTSFRLVYILLGAGAQAGMKTVILHFQKGGNKHISETIYLHIPSHLNKLIRLFLART